MVPPRNRLGRGQVQIQPTGRATPVVETGTRQRPPPGAMRTRPKFELGQDINSLQSQFAHASKNLNRFKAGDPRAKAWQDRLNQINTGIQRVNSGLSAAPMTEGQVKTNIFDMFGNQSQAAMMQGQFKPGDYSSMRQQASDAVMSTFEGRMNPRFEQEQEALKTEMMNRGIPESSPMYAARMKQLLDSQNQARLEAKNQAFLTGQGEQAQGFGQSLQTYQQPWTNLGVIGNVLAQQQNLGFNQQKLAQDKELALKELAAREKVARIGSRGGGGGRDLAAERQLMIDKWMLEMAGQIPNQGANMWDAFNRGAMSAIPGGVQTGMRQQG